jgi:phosphoribosylformylglycinamidine cyclo-ligase
MRQNKWYVLTGGPATGKTSLLASLKAAGFEVILEAARSVIDDSVAVNVPVEILRSDEKDFQEKVARRKIETEKYLDRNQITFFDRGMQDSHAYLNYYGFRIEEWVTRAGNLASYEKVFLLDPLHTKYERDYARTEDDVFADKIQGLLAQTYSDYGMDVVIVPAMSISDRVNFILESIGQKPTKSIKQDSYAKSGVDYSAMDPIKVLAQQKAKATAHQLDVFNAKEIAASRGESAYVWEETDAYRSLVIEGLGTKNLVADATRQFTGKTHYDAIAQDTIAMVVNDLIVVGALPQVVNAYFAIGDSEWMNDAERAGDLINGWADACQLAGAAWGGGETPTLKGIINPSTIDLGGSAIGIISPKDRLVLGEKLVAGDVIILIASSGIHANGLTMARSIAEKLPDGYATKLSDGRLYGEALLTPTPIYVDLVRSLMEAKINLHYMVNITGHGWRKLMRATKDFTYRLHTLIAVHPEFSFIQDQASASDEDMYGNFNMGAGFALYVPASEAKKVIRLAKKAGHSAIEAGVVEAGPRQVIIEPKNITFAADSLGVR